MKLYSSKLIFAGIFLTLQFETVFGLWCYQCVSSHPGCGMYDFDWRYYWSHYCSGPNDKCVKIIEQRGAELMVIRDCLSNIEGIRRDVPADHYEGCRPAATDPLLAHYVNTSIPELDVRRDHYTDVLYCFCDFDERCNNSTILQASIIVFLAAFVSSFFGSL